MDKKTNKKIHVLNQKLQNLRQRLAGTKRQNDEPCEVSRLESEIRQVEAEMKKLREL